METWERGHFRHHIWKRRNSPRDRGSHLHATHVQLIPQESCGRAEKEEVKGGGKEPPPSSSSSQSDATHLVNTNPFFSHFAHAPMHHMLAKECICSLSQGETVNSGNISSVTTWHTLDTASYTQHVIPCFPLESLNSRLNVILLVRAQLKQRQTHFSLLERRGVHTYLPPHSASIISVAPSLVFLRDPSLEHLFHPLPTSSPRSPCSSH